jgi:maltose-binding protein MalE
MPHDNVGRLISSGVAAVIDLGDKADLFLPNAIEAFMDESELYGVPFALENIGFFRNTEMVPDAPKTRAEVAEIGRQLVDAGQAESAIALPDLGYNYYPVYASFGGYFFGRDENGNYNADDLGMGSEGMIEGADWANTLIREGYTFDLTPV